VEAGKKLTLLHEAYIPVKISELDRFAVHRLFDKFLNYYTLQLK
jgi:hypothetical protein